MKKLLLSFLIVITALLCLSLAFWYQTYIDAKDTNYYLKHPIKVKPADNFNDSLVQIQ